MAARGSSGRPSRSQASSSGAAGDSCEEDADPEDEVIYVPPRFEHFSASCFYCMHCGQLQS